MSEIAGFRVGGVELTRVPYFDVALDPDIVHLTVDDIDAIEWAKPTWAAADSQVLVGLAVWVVVSQGQLIVIDPVGAADQFVRSGPEAIGHQEAVLGALRDAGFPPERVDVVVLSHLDGIGMTAVVTPDGSWGPAFPNARIVMTAAELEYLAHGGRDIGLEALQALIAQGLVDGVADGHAVTDEVRLELTAGHSPGHAVVHVRSEGQHATFVGHLALSPMNFSARDRSTGRLDPPHAAAAVDALLAASTDTETLLIGPLWPFPGAGYVTSEGFVAAD